MVVFFVNIGEVLPSLRVVVVVVVVVEEVEVVEVVEEEEVAAASPVAVIVARLSLPVEVVVNVVGFEEVLLVLVEFVAAVPRFKGRVQALILELDELEVVLDRDRSES